MKYLVLRKKDADVGLYEKTRESDTLKEAVSYVLKDPSNLILVREVNWEARER